MKVDKERFFEIISHFDVVPFLQSRGWFESMNFDNVEFHVDSDKDPNIGFWGIVTQHKILGKKLLIDSYCYKIGVSQKQLTNFFQEIIDSKKYDIIHLSDIDPVNPETQIAFRRAGFIRPLALALCPMSIVVETDKDFKFHRNWRRQVAKSINNGNTFEIHSKVDTQTLSAFVQLFNELKNRKALGFGLAVEQLDAMLKHPEFLLSLVRNKEGKPLCARITYLRNNRAYDVFAANSDESLSVGAVYQNQQQLFDYLKSVGCVEFDYGRIPPGRDSMDNIYVAKSYSGGRPIVYNGEWEFAKSNLKNWLYAMYRFAIRKSKRY